MSSAGFPALRARRLRRGAAIREMVQEVRLHPSDFIAPLFVQEGTAAPTAVTLLGHAHPLKWSRTADGLRVELPAEKPCESAFVLKIAH